MWDAGTDWDLLHCYTIIWSLLILQLSNNPKKMINWYIHHIMLRSFFSYGEFVWSSSQSFVHYFLHQFISFIFLRVERSHCAVTPMEKSNTLHLRFPKNPSLSSSIPTFWPCRTDKKEIGSSGKRFVIRMVLILLLLLILQPSTVCKKHSINCTAKDDPLPIPHEFYQPGDIIIGETVSQVFSIHSTPNFTLLPAQMLLNEPM